MHWWKMAILSILSVLVLVACQEQNSVEKYFEEQEKREPIDSLAQSIDFFLHAIQEDAFKNTETIDSLGIDISQRNSLLTYYPFDNVVESNTYLFAFQDRKEADVITQHSFFSSIMNVKDSTHQYQVWRGKVNTQMILDISLEPHPTKKWVLIFRYRRQE